MAVRVTRTCGSCGFDSAEPDLDCPLCGVSAVTLVPSPDAPTVAAATMTPADDYDPSQPIVFGERYRTERLLGRGGMGDVFRVHDTVDGRDLALKVLRRSLSMDPAGMDRFRREVAVLTRLKHPGILRILDQGVHEGDPFFVTEIAPGQDLRQELQKRGTFPVKDGLAVAAAVADALVAVHAEAVVHRDIKPANIMLGDGGLVQLVDFGLARPEGIDVERVTRTGEFVGTPAYMSPEQFDARTVDARSDIYSLGVVLFEVLTGHTPLSSNTVLGMAMKHAKEQPMAPSVSRPDLPPWLDRIVLRCLEKDPSRRFQSAALLLDELRRERTGGVVRPRKLSSGDRVLLSEGDAPEWALVLAAPAEKDGWVLSMGLRFEDRLFRLVRIDPPAASRGLWKYRFTRWPEGEVIRRLVAYDTGS